MKKLLTGFTLAEILVTLAIIGVVARVTLPTLMSNVTDRQTTTTLAKAMNTMEVGNKNILAATSSRTLTGAGVISLDADNWDLDEESYLVLLGKHLNGQYDKIDYVIDGQKKENLPVFISKDGVVFADGAFLNLMDPLKPYVIAPDGRSKNAILSRTVPKKYSGHYAKIVVDVNGLDGPNKIAKDQFVFYIDNKGIAIPYGGSEYAKYAGSNSEDAVSYPEITDEEKEALKLFEALWKNDCNAGSTPSTLRQRAACTGSIIDNGYKIIYNY